MLDSYKHPFIYNQRISKKRAPLLAPEKQADFNNLLNNFPPKIRKAINNYEEPFLIIDSNSIQRQIQSFQTHLPQVHPHFAVKANPHPEVISAIAKEDVSFEIASKSELDLLIKTGISPGKIYFSNPVKPRSHIQYAAKHGVTWFAVDNENEVHKVLDCLPKANLYIRLHTSNKGSAWPLSGKFGAGHSCVQKIMNAAQKRHGNIAGLTFHVGSQCTHVNNWIKAINLCRNVFSLLIERGFSPSLLDIGGGFPAELSQATPKIAQIGRIIDQKIVRMEKELGTRLRVIAEPGRFFVAESGTLVCQVIAVNHRSTKQHWLHLDAGYYSGLLELKDGLVFPILSNKNGAKIPWQLAGPTCDSIDVFGKDILLPDNLAEGDILLFKSTGAYVTACATEFNGFPAPKVIVF